MTIKLEAGKYYMNAEGEKVGPMRDTGNSSWPFKAKGVWAKENGETQSGMGDHSTPNLIAEWHDEPAHRPFGELSDAEKGALLLAKHDGKRLQWKYDPYLPDWDDVRASSLRDGITYRIAPPRITGTCELDVNGKPDFDTWQADK